MAPSTEDVARYTDKYFVRTRAVVERFGDCQVTYAVFMRRPVLSTPRLALDWLRRVAAEYRCSLADALPLAVPERHGVELQSLLTLWEWDGATWSQEPLPASAEWMGGIALLGIWGSAPNDIWAVGDRGVILHRTP